MLEKLSHVSVWALPNRLREFKFEIYEAKTRKLDKITDERKTRLSAMITAESTFIMQIKCRSR